MIQGYPDKPPSDLILQCNTRECDGVPERHGVRSLPTFIFYKNRQRQNDLQFVGADVEKLERIVEQNIMPTTFTGSGNRLGGGGGSAATAASAPPPVNSRPQGNCPKFDTKRLVRIVRFWSDFRLYF